MNKTTRGELACISGHRAYFGHGTKQNYQMAFEWYRKSAELENADGMNHLAIMYEKELDVQNIDKAIKYYRKAIDLLNMDAKYNLANLYYHHIMIQIFHVLLNYINEQLKVDILLHKQHLQVYMEMVLKIIFNQHPIIC